MRTLQDAWDWYEATRTNLIRMKRLGSHHWNHESLKDASIWQDEYFKEVEAYHIKSETEMALQPLEDLGILVLFSVFEATVRDHFEAVIKPMTGQLGHPMLDDAANKAIEGIQLGSFANHVLKPLQKQQNITDALSDKVNQVRKYRNWIAHGKRAGADRAPARLTARESFDRLKEFLVTLKIDDASEQDSSIDEESERPPDEAERF